MPATNHIGPINLSTASDTLLGAMLARIESALAASRTGIALAAADPSADAHGFIAEQHREIADLESKRNKLRDEINTRGEI